MMTGDASMPLKVEVDVLVRGIRVTAKAAAIIQTHMKVALAEAYPGHDLRGLWVHEDLPRQADRRAAVQLVLSAPECEDARDFVMEAIELAQVLDPDAGDGRA